MAGLGRLKGAVALVTAAGQGLGEEISRMFAAEGASVAVTDVNLPEIERVGAAIGSAGGEALVLRTDATRDAEVKDTVAKVLARWGRIDILVNAAGGFHRFAPITDIAEEE